MPGWSLGLAPPWQPQAAARVSSATVAAALEVSLKSKSNDSEGAKAECGYATACEHSETTVKLSAPTQLTRDLLLDVLNDHDVAGLYDFVYLPMNFATTGALGYALVNFITKDCANRFIEVFQGFDQWPVSSATPAQIVRIQGSVHEGLQANIERYRNSPVMHDSVPDEFKPAFFKDGVRQEFPSPSIEISPPPKVQTKASRKLQVPVPPCHSEPSIAQDSATTTREALVGSSKPEVLACSTVTIRELPPKLSYASLLSAMRQQGFQGLYDFVYLALDFEQEVSRYCIVNFCSLDTTERFRRRFYGFRSWPGIEADRGCKVVFSGAQRGLNANVERYRNSPVMHGLVPERFKPRLFQDGELIAFPAPTETLRMPKVSRSVRCAWEEAKQIGNAVAPDSLDDMDVDAATLPAKKTLHVIPAALYSLEELAPARGIQISLVEHSEYSQSVPDSERSTSIAHFGTSCLSQLAPSIGRPLCSLPTEAPPGLGLSKPLMSPPGLEMQPVTSSRERIRMPFDKHAISTSFLGEGNFSVLDRMDEDAVELLSIGDESQSDLVRGPTRTSPVLKSLSMWHPKALVPSGTEDKTLAAKNAIVEMRQAEARSMSVVKKAMQKG